MNDLERIEKRYDRRIGWMLFGLAVGVTSMTVAELLIILDKPSTPFFGLTLSAFILSGWAIVLVMLFTLSRDNDLEMLAAPVDDERVRDNRLRAYQFAFSTVLTVQLVLMIGGALLKKFYGIDLSLNLTANLTIGLGLAAALFRFQQLNR